MNGNEKSNIDVSFPNYNNTDNNNNNNYNNDDDSNDTIVT